MKYNVLINELLFLSQITKSLLSIKIPGKHISFDILGGMYINEEPENQIDLAYLNNKPILGVYLASCDIELTMLLIPDSYHEKYDFFRNGYELSITHKKSINQ